LRGHVVMGVFCPSDAAKTFYRGMWREGGGMTEVLGNTTSRG